MDGCVKKQKASTFLDKIYDLRPVSRTTYTNRLQLLGKRIIVDARLVFKILHPAVNSTNWREEKGEGSLMFLSYIAS